MGNTTFSLSSQLFCLSHTFLLMKKYVLFFIAYIGGFSIVSAQNSIVKSLESDVPGQGKVVIRQDVRIEALIGTQQTSSEEKRTIKSAGYRIQVYAGNNTSVAKREAHAIGANVKQYFPDLPVYTYFTSPRWLCRVGDFRSIEEADAMMRRLRATGNFKEVSIVREQINIPL